MRAPQQASCVGRRAAARLAPRRGASFFPTTISALRSAKPAGIELVEVGDWDAGPKRSKWTPEVLNANTLLMPIELPESLGAGCASLLCGLLTRDASVRLGAGGAAEVMRHPWLRPVEFELLRRGVPLPAPFVPDSRLVYARDDLAGGPRSKGGVDDAPAEGAADGEATIDVAGWEFHGGGWKDELQEYASKARL